MKKKTIVTVFRASRASTVGNANRISRYQCLAKHYRLIVLTNHPEFIQTKVNARVVPVHEFKLAGLSRLFFWIFAGLRLLTLNYDLLFLIVTDSPISFFNFHKPFLCHIHQSHSTYELSGNGKPGYLSRMTASLIQAGVRRASYCLAVSDPLVKLYVDFGVNPERICCLPHGVDLEKFSSNHRPPPFNLPEEKLILIYCGWVSKGRGIDFMLEGMRELSEENINVHLVVVGVDEQDIQGILDDLQRKRISDRVSVYGHVDFEELPGYIGHAHIGLSFREANNFYSFFSPPQKLFEYFAMGLPVICNNIPTHTSYVEDGNNGLVIDLDLVQFCEAVLKLSEDRALLQKLQNGAKATALLFDMKLVELKLMEKVGEMM